MIVIAFYVVPFITSRRLGVGYWGVAMAMAVPCGISVQWTPLLGPLQILCFCVSAFFFLLIYVYTYILLLFYLLLVL